VSEVGLCARISPASLELGHTDGACRWLLAHAPLVDDRHWRAAKDAVALDARPALAQQTAALMTAAERLGFGAVVIDLDNTRWGGVIAGSAWR
jgi:hypothetical protein